MPAAPEQRYAVIPLSIQQEGDVYLVGDSETGDFYQFPDSGVMILRMLIAGDSLVTIRARLTDEAAETVDLDAFITQLSDMGFIYPADAVRRNHATAPDTRRIFDVTPRVANAVFSLPVPILGVLVTLAALTGMIRHPELRVNFGAFYTETNRTALLLSVMLLSLVQVALHEIGHMLAAARHGIRSRYGIGNRLWMIVVESDLTGLLTLPKSQRYFPMLAGILVDIVSASLLTLLFQLLLRLGASAFTLQVVQALVLEIVLSIAWQFNIFVKTDIYFVLCTYFGHPDLDRDARNYVRAAIHRATMGLFGSRTSAIPSQNVHVLRIFSMVWFLGRVFSLLILLGVFLPTMGRYVASAIQEFFGKQDSFWMACDTLVYVSITATMLGAGTYMWLKQRHLHSQV